MNTRLLGLMRLARRLLNLLAFATLVLILATSLGAYLALSGRSLPLLRDVTAGLGHLLAGQRTDNLKVAVQLFPTDGRIAGTATLTVHSLTENRSRFYFLFNNALHVRDFRANGAPATPSGPHAYRLWLLTVVDLGAPVAKDAAIELTFDYEGQLGGGLFGIAPSTITPQQVLLNTDAFWYPTDAQGFFSTDVAVTLPSSMTLVHNGIPATRIERGTLQEVHWISERPVAGVAIVAGTYRLTSRTVGGITYRVYLADDVPLDANRILQAMADANQLFTERYGASGFTQTTLFVSRDLRRGFNDGSGLMGLSIRYFRAGDYGFALIAHELAHDWWGDTVAQCWLSPGTGGEWIVEGLAEASSVLAAEARYGAGARTRRLAGECFDPALQTSLNSMSVLDNLLAEATARDTIYRKGAYVALMLRRTLGDDTFFKGLRQFVERFRYLQVTEGDLQAVLQEASGQDLQPFFADWVRSDHLLDLSLDANGQSALTVNNLGNAAAPADIDLWSVPKAAPEGSAAPLRRTVHLGDTLSFSADTEAMVLDPGLVWADVSRANNRYPRRNDPLFVSASTAGSLAITEGEGFPWSRTTVSTRIGTRTDHTWDFERGLLQPPVWSADGTSLIVSASDPKHPLPAIVVLERDGTRRTAGYGSAPAGAADGSIYTGRQDRIVRIAPDGAQSTLVRQAGYLLDLPLPSPDGTQLAYTAARGNRLDVHLLEIGTHRDRLLCSWDRDRVIYRWGPDGLRLFAVVGGSWDWQVWEIPLQGEGVRVLASDAAAIGDLAVSPDAGQLAFSAAPGLDYPTNRRRVYVLGLTDHTVKSIDAPGMDFGSLTWSDEGTIAAVGAAVDPDQPWTLPVPRMLKQIRVADESVLPF